MGPSHKDKLVTVVGSELYGVGNTSKMTKVPEHVIRRWRNEEELAPYVNAVRLEIIGKATDAADKAWDGLITRLDADIDAIPTKELLAIAAEATNKMQLLTGGATSRSETRDVTEGVSDAEMQVIVHAARRHLERHGPSARALLVEGTALEVPAPPEPDTA
jgi:hypothetical protein